MPNSLTDMAAMQNGPGQQQVAPVNPGANPQAAPGSAQPVSLEEAVDVLHKQATIDRKLRALLGKGGPIARKDILKVATELVAERVVSAQAAAGYLIDLPSDPDKIRAWVEKHAADADDHLTQLMQMVSGAGVAPDQTGQQ